MDLLKHSCKVKKTPNKPPKKPGKKNQERKRKKKERIKIWKGKVAFNLNHLNPKAK